MWGVVVGAVGIVLAAWIAFGRALFGVAGSLTPVYALTLGIVVVVLHLFIAQGFIRTAQRGFGHRTATYGTLFASWGCAIALGLLIPDITADGLQTILTGTGEPGRGIAIGFANPIGIIMIVFAAIALVLARGDALGRADAPPEEEDGF
ncbi:hypothetical protein ET475_15825 [Microbacterium protaetiae]|uniref:Uncharacterized protein n=1 Tax=Microbacterium protaetiae TaxID=2509458 RepID=A0A4P6EHN4_9MICO|nr:hypothetical protein ET475_15825 [Microbacterium protaetiae]